MSKKMVVTNKGFCASGLPAQTKQQQDQSLDSTKLSNLQKVLKYNFRSVQLLHLALTHCSLSRSINYERLEFLGDRVLSLVIGDSLVDINNTKSSIGHMVNKFNHLVCSDTLCAVAKKLQLFEYIMHNTTMVDSILTDCLEAIIGAIYYDGGLLQAQKFILYHWRYYLSNYHKFDFDPKMQLQEWTQSRSLGLPCYRLLHEQITDQGERKFTVLLRVAGYKDIQATGARKQKAEQAAAQQLLQIITAGDAQ